MGLGLVSLSLVLQARYSELCCGKVGYRVHLKPPPLPAAQFSPWLGHFSVSQGHKLSFEAEEVSLLSRSPLLTYTFFQN